MKKLDQIHGGTFYAPPQVLLLLLLLLGLILCNLSHAHPYIIQYTIHKPIYYSTYQFTHPYIT
jgi:hypothetical protein